MVRLILIVHASFSSLWGQIPFGYTRKDVILIGVGITALGVGLKYGLEVLYSLYSSSYFSHLLLIMNQSGC